MSVSTSIRGSSADLVLLQAVSELSALKDLLVGYKNWASCSLDVTNLDATEIGRRNEQCRVSVVNVQPISSSEISNVGFHNNPTKIFFNLFKFTK